MGMKRKEEALRSFQQSTKTVRGVDYTVWSCYVGTDKLTHSKVRFVRSSKEELKRAVEEFYAAHSYGLSPRVAKDFTAGGFADYQLARQILDAAGFHETTLVEAARAFTKVNKTFEPTALHAAYTEYTARYSDVQKVQLSKVRNTVGRAIDWFGRDTLCSAVTMDQVKGYLNSQFASSAPGTWNGNRDYIASFFKWCVEQHYCAENPAAGISKKAVSYAEPEFVKAASVRRIFDLALTCSDPKKRNQMVWMLALSFFNGVRTEEIFRITRGACNLDEGFIRVMPKGYQHGMPPRMVYLTPTALAWLRAYPVRIDGPKDAQLLDALPLQDSAGRYVKAYADRHKIAIDFPHNAGRHSFVTMHIALHGEPAKTEALVGTSSDMRVKHYQGLATKREAEEYFNVLPVSAEVATAAS